MEYLRVRNFEKFQHYKDRTPPWIKLYNDILDDYEFSCLSDTSKAHLILMWLLASRSDNKMPDDPAWIAKKIGATHSIDLQEIMDAGFIEAWGEPIDTEKSWGSRYIPKKTKEVVLERDNGECQSCGSIKNIEFDHITPVSKGGESTETNLQLLCRSCNRKKRVRSTNYTCAEQVATQKNNQRSLEREGEREGETEETYPQELNEEAWRSYIQYRKESKLKKLTRQGEQIKIKWLIKQGDHLVQQKIIEHSISNGYTGLFELKQGVSHGTHQQDNSAVGRVKQATAKREQQRQQESEVIDHDSPAAH